MTPVLESRKRFSGPNSRQFAHCLKGSRKNTEKIVEKEGENDGQWRFCEGRKAPIRLAGGDRRRSQLFTAVQVTVVKGGCLERPAGAPDRQGAPDFAGRGTKQHMQKRGDLTIVLIIRARGADGTLQSSVDTRAIRPGRPRILKGRGEQEKDKVDDQDSEQQNDQENDGMRTSNRSHSTVRSMAPRRRLTLA
jgi:hypothetical protein